MSTTFDTQLTNMTMLCLCAFQAFAAKITKDSSTDELTVLGETGRKLLHCLFCVSSSHLYVVCTNAVPSLVSFFFVLPITNYHFRRSIHWVAGNT